MNQEIETLSQGIENQALAERFKKRAVELARGGSIGAFSTRKAALQGSLGNMVSLIDDSTVNFLIYGEEGAGKRRLVEEYFVLQNFYRRLAMKPEAKLKVLSSLFLQPGFRQILEAHEEDAGALIYIEKIDRLSMPCQIELRDYLKDRKKAAENGLSLPRLIFGTEKALSMMMIKKDFDRELFQLITAFAIFLPSLNERPEDMLGLIQGSIEELGGKRQSPPRWLVDSFTKQLWAQNIDEMRKVLKNMLARKSNVTTWVEADLPMDFRKPQYFERTEPKDFTKSYRERILIRQALIETGGDRLKAAGRVGLSRGEFLKRLLQTGLR